MYGDEKIVRILRARIRDEPGYLGQRVPGLLRPDVHTGRVEAVEQAARESGATEVVRKSKP